MVEVVIQILATAIGALIGYQIGRSFFRIMEQRKKLHEILALTLWAEMLQRAAHLYWLDDEANMDEWMTLGFRVEGVRSELMRMLR
jgi:branched-subunit amino acid ABC-type transport system permease component